MKLFIYFIRYLISFELKFSLINQNQPNVYLVGSLKENKLIKMHQVSNLRILKCIISW